MAVDPVQIKVHDPSDKNYQEAVESGIVVTINAGSILTDDGTGLLKIVGPCDRVVFMVSDLKPKVPSAVTYPINLEWGVAVGSACVLDRRRLITGSNGDDMSLQGKDDKRAGVLYHIANFLAGQWVLFGALTPGTSSAFTARISILADCRGGGGELAVFKGSVLG